MTNGWRGILLSPIYGAIFASLLFVLFAAGILNGSVFPTIVTPGWNSPTAAPSPVVTAQAPKGPSATPSVTQLATATPAGSPTSNAKGAASPGSSIANQTEAEKSQSPTPAPVPTPAPSPRTAVLQIRDFLQQTGPRSGIAYALLIIWSFLAGFAERLVPDTLNRLVQKNLDISGGGS